MNAKTQHCVKRALRCGVIGALAVYAGYAQTQINLGTQGRNVDFSNFPSTRPVKTGTALPATCSVGDLFFQTSAPQGQNLFGCPAINSWTLLGDPGSALFYQTIDTNGTALTQNPALNFSSAFSAINNAGLSRTDLDLATVNTNVGTFGASSEVPVITVNAHGLITAVSTAPLNGQGAPVWGSITGTLSNQTDLQTILSGKQASGNYLTAITGDGAASGPGSAALTLATVNSAAGECGDATHVCQVTTDGKGRVTTQAAVPIAGGQGAISWGSITGTLSNQTDLQNAFTAKQAAGNYVTALSGDVTASGPGSAPATLATVNTGAGQCGDATHVCQVTTDGKGRVTTQAAVPITGGGGGAAPAWGSITGTLSNQTDLETTLSGKQASGNYLTAITGDGAASGPGSAALTLATVNTGAGQCGDATHVCQVTTDGKGRVTTQAAVPIAGGQGATAWGSITGTLSNQTDLQNAFTAKQAAGDYVTALSGDVTASGPGSSSATLATVNTAAGQCGDATHICQVTTNGKGLVTSQTPVALASGTANATSIRGTAVSAAAPTSLQVLQYQVASNSYVPATLSSGSSNWAAGTLAAIPAACTPGSGIYVYLATDQPAGQQELQCSASNVWTQILNIGPSGALAVVNGSLDIITSVVPRLPNTNTFTGSNSFSGPVFQIGATSTDPGCAVVADIGKIWINNASATSTAYEVCLAASGTVAWVVK